MAPNVFFVQRYLRDHNIDAMLAEAVNQAVERKEKDPAASLAKFFSQYSRRNGEITNISARTVMNLDLQPVLEVTVECFKNGGTQVAATTVGLLAIPAPPPVEGEEAAEEEGVKLEGEAALQALAERINTDVRAALLGSNVRTMRENDDTIRDLADSVPPGLVSVALAEGAAAMVEKPLWLHMAETVKAMSEEHSDHIGGGVEVTRGLGEDSEGTVSLQESSAQDSNLPSEEDAVEVLPGVGVTLPTPIFPGIAAGDLVAGSKVRMRAFSLVGKRDAPLRESIANLIAVHRKLGAVLAEKNGGAAVAILPDGSYSGGNLATAADAIAAIQAATEAAELVFGEDVSVSVNFGANSYFKANTGDVGSYAYQPEGDTAIEANDWPAWIDAMLSKHPQVRCIIDACADEDFDTWDKVRKQISGRGERVLLLGLDLYKDDADKLRQGVAEGWSEGAVLSGERMPTVTDLVDGASLFSLLRPRASKVILALRPGATTATSDADFAVGLGCWGMMFPAPGAAGVARMNRVIQIEEDLKGYEAQGASAKAHLITWEKVEEEETAREERLAEEAQAAADGP